MKYYSTENQFEMNEELKELLLEYRDSRNFDVKKYLDLKMEVFNSYIERFNIDSCVVALSGGIDSTVVYAMLQYFKANTENSNLKNIYGICLPAKDLKTGVTNQDSLTKKVEKLLEKYGQNYRELNVTPLIDSLNTEMAKTDFWVSDDWAKGQSVSYLRTPMYYYVTSLLTARGEKSVVVGTTNKDEGAYLGYFGKASDGMVDIQLVSDIHKREVYEIAKYLTLPNEIIEAVPTGDMYDNRSDEEVFGTSYDFVELYLWYLESIKNSMNRDITQYITKEETLELFSKFAKNLEDLHDYNSHKYLGHSPAVHMDILKGTEKIKNGWRYFNYEK